MPSLELKTNVFIADPKAFSLEFSKFAAETLNKPESYISVSYLYQEHLTFAGSFDPAFLLYITSLNNINPEVNQQYSKAFFAYFKEKLSVEGTRGYITFSDPGRDYLGYNSTTVAAISK
ncbi:Tautomerase/MIF [Trametes versicolor FP-101664 SS1]|uniref:Tautomerase/MIF n=1 Tax=Trametes versicolor (strain FP-101664) TaxID=717944 RepID=UPI000462131F|nr:Tautomerase/MIF [Trametes versicolor FP-101664 SS1]EIW60867.1 Tautomerase/MIF [Trametes versicolor FP-101664 SS1]